MADQMTTSESLHGSPSSIRGRSTTPHAQVSGTPAPEAAFSSLKDQLDKIGEGTIGIPSSEELAQFMSCIQQAGLALEAARAAYAASQEQEEAATEV